MNIGGGKVRSERMLLAKVENGKNMMSADSVRFLVLHCSATRCNQDYSVEQLRRDHKARGFYDIGYHFYIRKDGTMTQHRRGDLQDCRPCRRPGQRAPWRTGPRQRPVESPLRISLERPVQSEPRPLIAGQRQLARRPPDITIKAIYLIS